MASYIPQIQGYIPQYQPFKPDFNFYAGALQMKQSQYDAAHKQLSTLYTSLLNSPLTADENVAKRDEIFNMINQDIKKISAVDLSLAENISAAKKVFDPIYQDDNIVKDMTWTKNWYNAMQTHESLKGCTDPKKCGGQAWDTAVSALYYKRQEFKNASAQERLNFGDVSYTPYINVHEKAVELAKQAGLKVKQDFNTGQWIITKQNGELVQPGLYQLFQNVIGSDPAVQRMYDTGAYVKRKQFMEEKVASGEYASPEQAEMAYISSMLATANTSITKQKTNANNANTEMLAKRNRLLEKQRNGTLTYEELSALDEINNTLPNVQSAIDNLNATSNAVNNKTSDDIKSMRSRADAAAAHVLASYDFAAAAETLSNQDSEQTMKQNPYAFATFTSDLALRSSIEMARINNEYRMNELIAKNKLDMETKQFQHLLDLGLFDDDLMKKYNKSGGSGTPEVKQDANWAHAMLSKDTENLGVALNRNIETAQQMTGDVVTNQKEFLVKFFNRANLAKTPGATNAINKVFYENLNIKVNGQKLQFPRTEEGIKDLVDKLGTVGPDQLNTVFNRALQELNKNCPTCDNDWAKDFMKELYPNEVINEIAIQHKAEKAVRSKVQQDIKSIVQATKSLAGTAGVAGKEFAAYADADLMIHNDYLATEEQFVAKFKERHKNDERYKQIREVNTRTGEVYTGPKREGFMIKTPIDIDKEARINYERISDKVFETFNAPQNKFIPLDQGYNLKGGGDYSANVLTYDVNTKKYLSGPAINMRQDMDAFVKNLERLDDKTNTFNVGFGNPEKDNMLTGYDNDERNKQKAIASALRILNEEIQKRPTKTSKDNRITYKMSSIAANDENTAARTMVLNEELKKKLVGTEKKPGPLYNYSDELEEGISVFYDKRLIKLGSDLAGKATNLEYIARFDPEGVPYKLNNAVDISIKRAQDGSLQANGYTYGYVNNKRVKAPYTFSWPQETVIEDAMTETDNRFKDLKEANDNVENMAKMYAEAGYEVEGFVPKENK